MATTSTSHTSSSRTGLAIATAVLLAVVAVLLVTALATSRDPATTRTQTVTPVTSSEPDRGTGDPCALRHDVGGGFQEGLGAANRCDGPGGTPRTGGRLP
jgi:hypothetical protein